MLTRRLKAWGMGLLAMLGLLFVGMPSAHAQTTDNPAVGVRFVPGSTGATLKSLIAGQPGSGYLEYYLKSRGPTHLALVVRLVNTAQKTQAWVYQALPKRHYVHLNDLGPVPSMVMKALGGWWVRRGITNYNLDIQVNGPISAMWGATKTYLKETGPTEPLVKIVTHANQQGLPIWDARWLLPPFPNQGFIRFSYAQTECVGPRQILPSPSPAWPYVAYTGGILQGNGTFAPPIVVNWKASRIAFVSEIVPVRGQACSYDFYSKTPVQIGTINTPSFESPWGFYNLSHASTPYANLIVHTFSHYAGEPGVVPPTYGALYGGAPTVPALENIRYSWADHPGNQALNFKVDLYGSFPYHQTVKLMGGKLRVKAPSYQNYPTWVMDKQWPVQVFVQALPGGEVTSEGIYDWPAASVGLAYALGLTSHPKVGGFSAITAGYRGEYRVGPSRPVKLYVSPVDGRIHLLYAQRGLWALANGAEMTEANLNHGPYIDQWTYKVPLYDHSPASLFRGREWVTGVPVLPHILGFQVVTRMDALPGGYYVLTSPHGLTITRGPYRPTAGTLTPPTTHATWKAFTNAVRPWLTGKNPVQMGTWIQGIGTPVTIQGGRVMDLSASTQTFQMALKIPPGWSLGAVPGLSQKLSAGMWVLRWSGRHLTAEKGTAALPVPRINTVRLRQSAPGLVTVTVKNSGTLPWAGWVSLQWGGRTVSHRWVSVLGQAAWTGGLRWTPSGSGKGLLAVQAGRKSVAVQTTIPRWTRPSPLHLIGLSYSDGPIVGWSLELLLYGLLATTIIWAWRRIA